jgi:hypothetical protein
MAIRARLKIDSSQSRAIVCAIVGCYETVVLLTARYRYTGLVELFSTREVSSFFGSGPAQELVTLDWSVSVIS